LLTSATLVLAQASCPPSQRAVVTGARNFARTSGGAIGLALCNAIINAVFPKNLPSSLPTAVQEALEIDGFSADYKSSVSAADWNGIQDAYSLALRDVFIFFTPLVILCLALCSGMKESPLVDNAAIKAEQEKVPDLESGRLESPSSSTSLRSSKTALDVLPVVDVNGGGAKKGAVGHMQGFR
jgi:hypothetical protein